MQHNVRVLVRLDVDSTSAVLEIGGCLTGRSCQALFPIIRRTAALIDGLAVTVDLSAAAHIEAQGLEQLEQFVAGTPMDPTSPGGEGLERSTNIIAPEALPQCEVTETGWHHNEAAAA